MLRACRWNLRVLSYMALVVGAFLIYNTISVSVVRRRPEIGVLREQGVQKAILVLPTGGTAGILDVTTGKISGRALGK